jgi:DNA-binding transcriptional LysR family regulator
MILLDLPRSREYFLSVFQKKGLRPNIAERTSDIAVMRSMVANGFGYGIANMRPLNTLSPDGKRLVFIPLDDDIRALKMGVVTPNAEHRTRTVQAFIDHCRSFVREQGTFGTDCSSESRSAQRDPASNR